MTRVGDVLIKLDFFYSYKFLHFVLLVASLIFYRESFLLNGIDGKKLKPEFEVT